MLDNLDQLHGAAAQFAEKLILMERKVAPDGGGGFITQWSDGVEFEAATSNDISTEMRIAEAQGVVSTFTFSIPVSMPLQFNDYFKRKKGGSLFRVTSNPDDTTTHPSFPIQEKQFSAEHVKELPK